MFRNYLLIKISSTIVMTLFVSRIKPVINFTEPEKLNKYGGKHLEEFEMCKIKGLHLVN